MIAFPYRTPQASLRSLRKMRDTMATIKLAWIKWRDGHPRSAHSARERAAGFRDQDLRHDGPQGPRTGAWFTFEQAQAWSLAQQEKISQARASGHKLRPVAPPPGGERTVERLLADWLASRDVQALEPITRAGYARKVDAVLYQPVGQHRPREERSDRAREPFALAPVSAIEPPEVKAFVEHLIRARGLYMARGCRAVLQAAFAWGRTSVDWRLKHNPAAGLRIEKPAGRIVVWTDAEIRHMVATADAMGRASVGDAILLGVFTGQRQTDRVALEDGGLADGRRVFRQSKTGMVVAIRETPRLSERLAQARARVAVIALARGTRPKAVIVDEHTGLGYNQATYGNVFAQVRAHAAIAMPSCAGKRDQDLRDTAVTWLARAPGNDALAIMEITGHGYGAIETICRHYLGRNPNRADQAVANLVAWMDKEGMAV
jgi:integrase